MKGLLRILAPLVVCSVVAACGDDSSNVQILLFQASPDAIESGQSTTLVFAVEPPDAKVTINGLGDFTNKTQAMVSPAMTTEYQLTAVSGKATTNRTVTVTVGPTSASAINVTPATTTPVAGNQVDVTLTVLGRDGKPAPGFRGTVHVASTDSKAILPADAVFTAADAGVKHVNVTLETAGLSTLTATETTAKAGIQGSTSVTVQPAAAASYTLTTLPANAIAGESLVLSITAKDAFGNVATNYAGQAQLTSADGTDILPPTGTFTNGVRTVNLAFTKTGNHAAQVVDVAATIPSATTSTVAVGPAAPIRIAVTTSNAATTAGTAEPLTARVFDLFDNLVTNYTGTVHFAATDANAVLPADFTFTAGDGGAHDFSITLKTAGQATVTMTDTVAAAVQGAASWSVQPAAASVFALTTLPPNATAGQSLVLSITVQDAFANVVTGFAGQAQLTSADPTDLLPPVGGFTNGVRTVSLAFTKTGSHAATVNDVAGLVAPATTSSVTVGSGPPVRIATTTSNPATTAGIAEPLTARVLDLFDNLVTGYTGTVHFAATDANAVLPADFTFTAIDGGAHDFSVTLKTAGATTVTMTDTVVATVQGAASWAVQPAAASVFALTALPPSAAAGQSLVLSITVKDAFANVVTAFAGQAQLTSADPTDRLPATGGFINGVRTVSLAFTKTGSHVATVNDVAGLVAPATTSSVAVGAGPPFRVAVTTTSATTTAGSAEPVSTKIVDFFDNTVLDYAGTVHFAANDPQAVLPADFTFTPADNGAHDFSVTLKTSGRTDLAISDTVAANVSGAASWQVGAAGGANCAATQAPTSAVAGSVVGLSVVVHDTFGNVATGYAGTVRLTATDARANLPPDVTYVPATDAGSHAFSVGLLTTGSQVVTATDTVDPAIQCTTSISIRPAAPKLVLTVPGNANAGYAVSVGVAVKDLFDNAIPNYAGTVTFTNSDGGAGAATPAPITFTGSEGGVATTSATFITPGTQTLAASDTGAPQASGSAASSVHGLFYTAPSNGRVRLVANAAQSNANVVQLDLIANEKLEVSTFFGGGPGSFAAGMNLPLDTNRVLADTTLFTPGAALPLGAGARAAKGAIGPDHVLYTVVSRKRVAGTIFTQLTEVQAGQVFYSVRLKLQQNGTVGPVFDGAQPSPLYRASVRDQWGDDFVTQTEFGVGKLEIR